MHKNVFIALLGVSLGGTAFAETPHSSTGTTIQNTDTTRNTNTTRNGTDTARSSTTTDRTHASTSSGSKSGNAMSASKMTCQDFLALEDVERPKAVYWAEGLYKKGKADDAVFDVVSTDNIVPMLVEDCKATPAASFVKKAKTAKSKADMNK